MIPRLIKSVFTALGGFIGWFLGGMDGIVITLVIFVTIDYITGVMSAVVTKTLSSSVGYRGIFHKVCIFALVGIGNLLDTYVIKSGSILRTAVIFYYLSNEGLSIIENAGEIGLPIPKKLLDVLIQIHEPSVHECDSYPEGHGSTIISNEKGGNDGSPE